MNIDAEAYSKLGRPQFEMDNAFIVELELLKGDRFVDMGCGTGDITKIVSDAVGAEGKVIGVDPDKARIKLAQNTYKDVLTAQFVICHRR